MPITKLNKKMHSNRHLQKSKIAIVAIAASAGGVTAVRKVLSGLPADFPVPILCMQHLSITESNVLAQVLQLRTSLTVCWAHQGERLKPGVVYVCPPGYYFVVHSNGTISLALQSSKHGWHHGVNYFFESVAESYAERAVVVVMTGTGKGGAEGVQTISQQGGIVLAQDKASSVAFGMPEAAIATGCVHQILPREAIAPLLVSLVCEGNALSSTQLHNTTSLYPQLPISPMLQDALENLLERAIAMHRTDMGYIHLFDKDTCTLLLAVQCGFDARSLDNLHTVSIAEYSPCIAALCSGETVIVEDMETDTNFLSDRAIAKASGYRATQSKPLTTQRGNLVGVLSTHFRQPRRFLPWEMNLLDMHARHAADVIALFQGENVNNSKFNIQN
ncbi:GAF domain-containing protein [Calothrix sp. FACHB-1219]|uniref:chemotaxis protein CheB n=1 Tax=unclassified Calothrix TaxID=2619626 RepID=UPI0016896C6F|nr:MULTISPECIES: chemotaxis protein CheB [unclassified Calothrix]MBD2205900.1 GAF domain-containing protein [Calothrix sp. FACHB-168]MBD2220729.1 GAF domain-containing protein [Calothrix sp. FACHB-1219]